MSIVTQKNAIALINTIKKALQSNRFLARSQTTKKDFAIAGGVAPAKEDKKLSIFSFISFFNKNYIKHSNLQSQNDKFSFLSTLEKDNFTFLNYLLYIKKNLQKKSYYFQTRLQTRLQIMQPRLHLPISLSSTAIANKGKLPLAKTQTKLPLAKKSNNTFFKHQKLLSFKKSKAHHLEISYKSLSIIFLFTPQQICFPHFINFSLIYK